MKKQIPKIQIFSNPKFKFKANKIRAIELLINCEMTQKDIADEVGVSEKTLYNWIHHNEKFREALEWYRKEVYRNLAPTAARTVADIMLNGESDKVRLAAAQDILSRAGDDAKSKMDLEFENKLDVHISVVDEVEK